MVTRYALYLAFLTVALLSLPLFAESIRTVSFREEGIVENLQLGLLVVTGLLLGHGAWRFRACRGVLILMSCLATIGAIRELDYFFDDWNRTITWKGPAALAGGLGLTGLWPERQRFAEQLRWILGCPAVGVLWAAMGIVLFGQLVGNGTFMEAIMRDAYVRAHARMVEELFELFGYFLVLIGSVEVFIRAAAHPPRQQTPLS